MVIHMSDETPTNEELLTKIEVLEAELDEMQTKVDKATRIEKACREMAQKLARIHNEPLVEWWFVQ